MTLPTKYIRQRANARKKITRRGTTCVWNKAVESTADDTTLPPEMQGNTAPTSYPKVPIIFVPQTRLDLATAIALAVTGTVSNQLFAIIPGDVPFTPENGDVVDLPTGDSITVDKVNVTQPDLVPIIYEVSFK